MTAKILAFATALVIVGLLVSNFDSLQKHSQFENFKLNYAKSYLSQDQQLYRKSIFMMNLNKINSHNSKISKSYTLGINQFADLTEGEFITTYLGSKLNSKFTTEQTKRTMMPADNNGDIDWVASGKVTPIKNQGQCGSCWAFSATGSIESAIMLKGQQAVLSEQQLVDCSSSYGNQGCNGGWVDSAFQYIKDHGLSLESEYPYMAVNQQCRKNQGDIKITGFIDTPGCTNLLNALSKNPISVAVDASSWQFYHGGILNECGSSINHGVLVVGAGDNFWKIKNSWGPNWGESGFIRIAGDNTCQVCSYPSYPTV